MRTRIQNAFTEMLGCDYPIVAAPMFLVSYPDLVVAASEAGAVGAFPALNFRSNEEFAQALAEIKQRTHRPFAVNLTLKFNDRLVEDLRAVIKAEVPLLITSLGDPTEVIRATRGTRTRVYCDVISQRHASKVVSAGADGLIAVAYGAGGHAGQISPLVLGPWLKRMYGLPVLAAGGVSDGKGLAAVLSLGLDAAYMGTRFIATREAPATAPYKQAILDSTPEDIEFTPRVSGILGNYIRKSIPEEVTSPDDAKETRWKEIYSAGQVVGLIDDIPSCAELVSRIVQEYEGTRASMPVVGRADP